MHPALTLGRSEIAGRGLFASEDIAAGTVVLRLGGRLVSGDELTGLLRAACAGPRNGQPFVDTIAVDEDRHLVLPPGTAAHWGNHSCDPSGWHVGPYEIAARRALQAGDELTIDYGTNSGLEGFRMRCTCRAPACRREVTGRDWHRPELQERYRGHWTPALQALIDRS